MTFSYVALEPSGKKRTGIVEATDKAAAMALVQAEGRYVVEIKEDTGRASSAKHLPRNQKVKRADLALFTRRLSDLAEAGLPIDRALSVIAEQSESEMLSYVAEDTLAEVRGGLSVSQALAKHSKVFNEIYVQSVKAGEASGQFSQVTARLADFLETEVARRSALGSAMVYPSMLLLTAVGVIVFMLTFVVPRLQSVFDTLGDDLPGVTKILLAITGFLTGQWMIIVGILVGGLLFYRVWVTTDAGALARDSMLLRIPKAGQIITKAIISRYARVLGTLVYGGVPILEALSIAGMSAGNRLFKVTSDQVIEEVRAGRSIADALRDSGTFPPVLTHMVAIGEETGDLPKMLGRVANSLDFEVDTGMRRLITLAEPAIVLVMAVFVGFVVIAVILPIFSAQDLVK